MASLGHNPFLRFPKLSLVISALLCVPLLMQLGNFRVSPESRAILEGDQRNLFSYDKVREILSDVEVIVISMECDEVFSTAGLDAIRRVSNALEEQPGVEDVKSLTHSTKPVRRGFVFEMVPLVPRGLLSPTDLVTLKQFALEHPLIRDVMVARDSRHTLITVTYQGDLSDPERQRALRNNLYSVLEPFEREGLKFEVLGLPLAEDEIRTTLRSDLATFVPIAAVLLIGIMGLMFRSLLLLLVALGIQMLALAAIAGAVAWTGANFNVFTASLFPLLAGVQLTFVAHLFAAFQRAQTDAPDPSAAVAAALGEVFQSSLFAAITTTVALLSMMLSEVPQIRNFGLLGAIGTGLIFAITFGPGVAALRLCGGCGTRRRGQFETDEPRPGSMRSQFSTDVVWANRITEFAARFKAVILLATAIVGIAACAGISKVRTDIRAAEFLNSRSPTRQALESMDHIYGGINVVQLKVDSGTDGGVNNLEFLRYVESVQKYAEKHPDVSAAYSYAQLMAMINQIWEGGAPDALRLPQNPLIMQLFIVALRAGNFPFLNALADENFRTAYVVIRTRDMPADRYLAAIKEIEKFAESNRRASVSVTAAEGIHSILEADRRILRSQVRSAGTTVAVVAMVLALLWRSPALAFFSVLANVIPIALVLGLAGYMNVPLNSITVMVAAICFGIAVDDSIHLSTHWVRARREGCSRTDAVHRALLTKRRPIVFTSVILIALFFVFLFSSFPPVMHFGFLCAAGFFFALGSVLLLLPALLVTGSERRNIGANTGS